MGGLVNPILQELNNLSPSAKSALMAAHGAASATQPPNPTQGMQPPSPAMASIRAQEAPQGPAPAPMLLPPSQASTVPAMTSSAPAVKAPRGTLEGDQAHRADLMASKPGLEGVYGKIRNSDFGQAHPMAGRILGGLAQIPSTIADIGLSAGVPRIGALVPGTSAQHGAQLGAANKEIAQDQASRTGALQDQELQARIPFTVAQTEHEQAATDALKNPEPKPKEEHWSVSPEYTGPNGEPVEVEQNSGEMRLAGQPGSGFKRAAPKAARPDTPEQQFIDEFTQKNPNAGIADAVHAYAAATQKPERGPTLIQQNNEVDKVGARLAKPYDEGYKQGNATLGRIQQTLHSVDAGYVGQGLAIPELLTSLVSGQGTGVRITQPELNAITAARGIKGDAESWFNTLAGKGKLTDSDKQQIKAVLMEAQKRLEDKTRIHSQALDAINGAESRADVVKADKDARQKLNDLEKTGHFSGQVITLKSGKQVTVSAVHPDGSFDAN